MSHPAICSGDHRIRSIAETTPASARFLTNLQRLGRRARSQAASSAWDARYRYWPPLRLTSRLIVDGDLPSLAATERIDSPITSAREISSLSVRVRAVALRLRSGGRMPPVLDRTFWIDVCGRSNSWPIWCRVQPCFQRSHINAFWLAE